MGQFRQKRSRSRRALHLRSFSGKAKPDRTERSRQRSRQQEAHWAALNDICRNRASKARLAQLIARMTGADRGARESALAELELATLLIRAGFTVELLPETQAATADLRCSLGDGLIFVEVTALVGSTHRSRAVMPARANRPGDREDEEESPHFLTSRLLARIAQKARQLAHYEAPVVLAATVPNRDPRDRRWNHPLDEELDLKLLGGTVTLLLARLPHLSAALLSLWDVEPMPARSGVRLANVHVVERPRRQVAYPRVRVLILNPSARHPLSAEEVEKLRGTL